MGSPKLSYYQNKPLLKCVWNKNRPEKTEQWFYTVDPLADNYFGVSPYVYCANNPVIFVDPDGRAYKLVYGENGQVVNYYRVCDDEAYNMDGEGNYTNLKEGYSDFPVVSTAPISDDGGPAGQGDGYLTFAEAKAHYQFGGGTPVSVDLNKIDLSNVSLSDFGKNGRALVKLDGKHFSNVNDALVHGTITLQRIGNTNTASIAGQGYGMYNFEMHPWNSAFNIFVRNPATIMGAIVNSLTIIQTPTPIVIPTGGTPYPIYYRGTTTINP